MSEHSNALINSSSPYLRQHANNPVDWMEWTPQTLQKAKEEDKPILLSIGYSACHWCHVMAHESFEDSSVAAIMNDHFINIKVDREERPDVDQIYMEAIQAMGVNGGWPLNVFLTPDQKPFYGGTYFPKDGWKRLLISVSDAFLQHRDQLNKSAEQFTEAINKSPIASLLRLPKREVATETFEKGYERIKHRFDHKWGGFNGAPKFPMPSLWSSLIYIDHLLDKPEAVEHFLLTAHQISSGGIYDHIGGGFARYAVDDSWHVPHFEKMLYDNAQLLALLAQAFQLTHDISFLKTINETIEWLEREMLTSEGGYFSALDADSEGEEGKYYIWSEKEFDDLLDSKNTWIKKYFDVSEHGNWEGTNVLRRLHSSEEICEDFDLSYDYQMHELELFRKKALEIRSSRIRPGLDDKVISGWNGLLLTGLCEAYRVNPNDRLKSMCNQLYLFIITHLTRNNLLLHTQKGEIEGFADDYALVIQAYITYFETFFEVDALGHASSLMGRVQDRFFDSSDRFYFYVGKDAEQLIAQKKEIYDNVIPSSNSVLAFNLFKLGKLLDKQEYIDQSAYMVKTMIPMIEEGYADSSYWARVAAFHAAPVPEIVIIGQDYMKYAMELWKESIPLSIIGANDDESSIPFMANKSKIGGHTTIYICQDKTCQRPVHSINEAVAQIDALWKPGQRKS